MMVKRIDDEGFRWLEPPYTPEEQQTLEAPCPVGCAPSFFGFQVDFL